MTIFIRWNLNFYLQGAVTEADAVRLSSGSSGQSAFLTLHNSLADWDTE